MCTRLKKLSTPWLFNNDIFKKFLLRYKEVSKQELVRRLREKNEPIKLFGETHEETCQRLRVIEMMTKDEDRTGRNDFKAAMDRLDQAYVDRLASKGALIMDQIHKSV